MYDARRRETVVAACRTGQCQYGCDGPQPVEPVQCSECGVIHALCESCIEADFCAVCNPPPVLEFHDETGDYYVSSTAAGIRIV